MENDGWRLRGQVEEGRFCVVERVLDSELFVSIIDNATRTS